MASDDSALFLEHRYDPAKAREYYLRTRVLKGRKPGKTPVSTLGGPNKAGAKQILKKIGKEPVSTASRKAQKEALEAKLERLRDVLAKLVDQAKERSGVETKEKETSDTKESKDTKDSKEKPMTAAERKAQSERAKENYEKNKKTEPEKKDAGPSISELQEKIADVQAQIQDAMQKARSKPKSKTAPKGR